MGPGGPPMMPYGPGDSPHSGMMPPIPPAQNFYENFYQQQEGMEMEPGLIGDAGMRGSGWGPTGACTMECSQEYWGFLPWSESLKT